jgi:chorismate dehydratase
MIRLGVVSFLNARPLTAGLESAGDCELVHDVPSRLGELLDARRVDAASVPIVDYLRRRDDWRIVSDACIASDGPTLTVRVFARRPPERIDVLFADADSHTSIMLAQLIWLERFGRRIEIRPLTAAARAGAEAILLIGDKVVGVDASEFDFDLDLGQAWKDLTGLPMVFALWAARRDRPADDLAERLNAARDAGVAQAASIARSGAAAHGWPPALAACYLTRILEYRMTDRHLEGIERFHAFARRHGLLPSAGTTTPADEAEATLSCPR